MLTVGVIKISIWFRCKECTNKYYIATPLEETNVVGECDKCGGIVEPIYYEIEKFLSRNLVVDFSLIKNGPVMLSKGEVMSFNNKSISLIIYENTFDSSLYDFSVSCRVSFAREEIPVGRFYFDSEVLNYGKDNKFGVIISTPEYLIRKQERLDPRHSLRTDVKYKLADDIEKLMADDLAEYNLGWTVDISQSGALLLADREALENIVVNKYINLEIEYDRYKISTVGNIARVENVDVADERIALGINFLKAKSDNLNLIDDLRRKRIFN